jgi:hypothetical protein
MESGFFEELNKVVCDYWSDGFIKIWYDIILVQL